MIVNIENFDNIELTKLIKYRDEFESNEELTLVFEDRKYYFYKEDSFVKIVHFSNTDTKKYPEKYIYFDIENTKNIRFVGNGAKFIFNGDPTTFLISNSENIKFENLSIDYYSPTTVEMYVKEIFGKKVRYYIPYTFDYDIKGKDVIWKSEVSTKGKLYWSESNHFTSYANTVFDLKNFYAKRIPSSIGPFTNVRSIHQIDGDLEIEYYEVPEEIRVDTMIALNSSMKRDTAGFAVQYSKNISFENVTFNYLHGFGLLVQMSENIYFNNCKFKGNDRHKVSSFADSIHISGCKGEVIIKDSKFDASLDDPINIHGTYTRVEKVDGNKAVLRYVHHQQAGFKQYFVGDKVQFFSRDTLETDNEIYEVKNVIHPDEYSENLQYMEVEFDRKLPDYLKGNIGRDSKYVCENISYTPEVEINNCKFSNVPSRGILLTTKKKSKIKKCRFINMTMASIYLSNDANEWYESGKIEDLRILGNDFIFTDEFIKNEEAKPIWINPITTSDNNNSIHENILIRKNRFSTSKSSSIIYKNVSNLLVEDNEYDVKF